MSDHAMAGVARCFFGVGLMFGAFMGVTAAMMVGTLCIGLGAYSLYRAFKIWDRQVVERTP